MTSLGTNLNPVVDPSSTFSKMMTAASRNCYPNSFGYQKLTGLPEQKLVDQVAREIFEKAHTTRLGRPQSFLAKILSNEADEKVSKVFGKISIGIDLNSFARNTTSATSAILQLGESTAGTIVGNVVGGSAIAGGSFGFFVGLKIFLDRLIQIKQDYDNGNLEGGFEHSLNASMGASYGGVSAGLVISNAAVFAGATAVAAAAGLAISILGLIMHAAIGIRSGYGISENLNFKNQIELHEKSGEIQAARYIASLLQGSEAELNKKWDQFAFRASEECGQFVRECILNGTVDANAAKIVEEVKKANNKQLLKHGILMTIAFIGGAAFIATLALAGPLAPVLVPILFAIGACLWFTIDSTDVQKKLGDVFFGKAEIPHLQKEIEKEGDQDTVSSASELAS